MNAQTMLELADDIADIPQEVNLTPRQARLLQEAANRLRETAALPPSQEVTPGEVAQRLLNEHFSKAQTDMVGDDDYRSGYIKGIYDLQAALAGKPGTAHDQLSRLRRAILDHTQGDGFWIGEILLAVLAKETGFNGSVTRPERCGGGE